MNNVMLNVMSVQNTLFDAISQSNAAMKQATAAASSEYSFSSTLSKEIKNTDSSANQAADSKKASSALSDQSDSKDKVRTTKEKKSEKTKEEKISRKEEKSADSRNKSSKSSSKEKKAAAEDDSETENTETASVAEETSAEMPVEETVIPVDEELENTETEDEAAVEVAALPIVTESIITEEELAAYWNTEAAGEDDVPEETAGTVQAEVAAADTDTTSENADPLASFMKNTQSNGIGQEVRSAVKEARDTRNMQDSQNIQAQVEVPQETLSASAEQSEILSSPKEDAFIAKQTSQLTNGNNLLNTGSDFKLNGIKVENLNEKTDTVDNPQDVLKNLLGKARVVSAKPDSGGSSNTQGNQGNAYDLKNEIQNFLAANTRESGVNLSPGVSKLAQQGFNGVLDSVKTSSSQMASSNVKADGMNVLGQTQDISPARAFMSSPALQVSYSGGTTANAAMVGELISRMQDMIKGSNLDKGSKLSMDFESSSFGQVNLSVQQKGNTIAVNIQMSSDSSKDQLMQQRDDLANQLRMMGYKEVALDISSGRDSRENAQSRNKHSASKGNDDIQNVKLAGDDKADRASVAEIYS